YKTAALPIELRRRLGDERSRSQFLARERPRKGAGGVVNPQSIDLLFLNLPATRGLGVLSGVCLKKRLSMTYRKLGLSVFALGGLIAAFSVTPVGAARVPTISDGQLQAMFTESGSVGGAPSLNTGRTVPHWFGQTTEPPPATATTCVSTTTSCPR